LKRKIRVRFNAREPVWFMRKNTGLNVKILQKGAIFFYKVCDGSNVV
jgi:hypothetical protein